MVVVEILSCILILWEIVNKYNHNYRWNHSCKSFYKTLIGTCKGEQYRIICVFLAEQISSEILRCIIDYVNLITMICMKFIKIDLISKLSKRPPELDGHGIIVFSCILQDTLSTWKLSWDDELKDLANGFGSHNWTFPNGVNATQLFQKDQVHHTWR